MTARKPQQHCNHECVCNKYIDYTNTGATPDRICNGETWVSIEPIIDPWQSRYLIAETLGCVDLYRIGKMNHMDPGFPEHDLYEFIMSVKYLLESMGKNYIIKKDMHPYLQRMM